MARDEDGKFVKAKRTYRRRVTRGALRVRVPLLGWMAARLLIEHPRLSLELRAAARAAFAEADRVVRREARKPRRGH